MNEKLQLNTENVTGLHTGVWGDFKGLKGDVCNITGDVSGLEGTCTIYIFGDVSGLSGILRELKGDLSTLPRGLIQYPAGYFGPFRICDDHIVCIGANSILV